MNIDQCQNEEDYPNPFVDEPKKPNFTKESLTADFKTMQKVKVVFIKKDGSERTMICTKDNGTIPEKFRMDGSKKTDKGTRPTPDHLFLVFDLEANSTRSFTIDKVISVDPIL